MSGLTLDDVWPTAAEHLQPALAFGGNTHDLGDVRTAIEADRAQLWPMGDEGSLVTEVVETPGGKRICRIWLAGGTLASLLQAEHEIAKWAAELECDWMEIVGRAGWKRVLKDYRQVSVVLRKELKS